MRNLELVNDNLTAELEDEKADDNIIGIKIDGKMYGPAVRKAAYQCLANQVTLSRNTQCREGNFCNDGRLLTKSNNRESICI